MRALYKTIIVIWSDYDPTDKVELEDLARAATSGDAYCSNIRAELIEKPDQDKDWDSTEFFGVDDPEEGDTCPNCRNGTIVKEEGRLMCAGEFEKDDEEESA